MFVWVYVFSFRQLIPLEEDASETHKHNKHAHTSAMTVTSTTLGSSAQARKKQVKRRHRRKRGSCTAFDCVETIGKQAQTDRSDRSLSSDRSERGEKKEHSFRTRRELPPRLRCAGALESDSSTEGDTWREARSWSKEKARRARRRSGSSRERDRANGGKGGRERTEIMELQSVGSDEGKENKPLMEDSGGLKKRHSNQGSMKRDSRVSQRKGSQCREKKSCKSRSPRGSSSLAEDAEELITKRYQEKGTGGGDMSVPTPQKHCGVNGGTPGLCSDDSELEVCRLVYVFVHSDHLSRSSLTE